MTYGRNTAAQNRVLQKQTMLVFFSDHISPHKRKSDEGNGEGSIIRRIGESHRKGAAIACRSCPTGWQRFFMYGKRSMLPRSGKY